MTSITSNALVYEPLWHYDVNLRTQWKLVYYEPIIIQPNRFVRMLTAQVPQN